jgi:hypothetical protein
MIETMPAPYTKAELAELIEAGWTGDTIGEIPGPIVTRGR